jgi:hypothetical protein
MVVPFIESGGLEDHACQGGARADGRHGDPASRLS